MGTDSKPQLEQVIDTKGPIPIIKVSTAIGMIGMTPYFVVNWLYQALVDMYCAFSKMLGPSRFTAIGVMCGSGDGEVLLWWDSH